MTLRDPRTLLGLLALAVLSVAALPFLLRTDDPELESRRRRLAETSRAERERIERNDQQFAAMSDAERRQLVEFHAALQTDRDANHGRLNDTLAVYSDWLKSATPHQRDALRKEQDPARRIALLKTLVESQQDRRLEVRTGPRAERLGPIPRLSRADLDAMLDVLLRKAPIGVAQREELNDYEGLRRSLKLFETLGRQKRTLRDLLTDATMRQLLAAISDDKTREQIETIPDANRPRAEPLLRRLKLSLALFRAVEAELDDEVRRRPMTHQRLVDDFQALPEDEQNELLALTPDRFAHELRSRDVQNERSARRINMRLVRQFFRPQRPSKPRPAGRE